MLGCALSESAGMERFPKKRRADGLDRHSEKTGGFQDEYFHVQRQVLSNRFQNVPKKRIICLLQVYAGMTSSQPFETVSIRPSGLEHVDEDRRGVLLANAR